VSRRPSRPRYALTAAGAVVLAMGVPLAVGSSAAARGAHDTHRSAHAKQLSFKGTKTVIVYLRGQSSLPNAGHSRYAAARAAQAPVRDQLQREGARNIRSLTAVDAIVADVSSVSARSIANNPNVRRVIPDSVIHGPARRPAEATGKGAAGANAAPNAAPSLCGTAVSPELDPEALQAIHATPAELGSNDGHGVTVAYLADGVDPTNVDFQRNPAFASSGSPAGSPVLVQKDFSGDGTDAATPGGEAFLDAGSIASQGNHVYDLSDYVAPQNPLPPGCDIKVVGAAPGAKVLGLKVFGEDNALTTSNFVQAIDYAVHHGSKVVNESFGGYPFPPTAQDAVVQTNRAAVGAGVTVVSSTGDAGITNTLGSPSTDSKIISVAGSTTFRQYEQEMAGGVNVPEANGEYVNNNVSSLSSGGFNPYEGNVPDLLAPGDSNWVPCSTNTDKFQDCTDAVGDPTDLEVAGGTSESSPLTAAAAADVIQAYAATHGGKSPSPALVKRILMSTTRDVVAPASQGGAGLLNVKAAIAAAKSMPGTTGTKSAGVLLSPNQINTTLNPGAKVTRRVSVTNHGSGSETVKLSTRALTKRVATQTGSFCMQPGHPTGSCPANTGTFLRETGVKQVYEAVPFTVPARAAGVQNRLIFNAAYPDTGQTSVLKVALLEPDGTYAGYSVPQGQGDYADVEVANPPAGHWTAIVFTSKTNPANDLYGTKGRIRWSATTSEFRPAGQISPSTLKIPAGKTKYATLSIKAPGNAGDADRSVVVKSSAGTTTIPVTVRTLVPFARSHGQFHGVLTGGNGRDGLTFHNGWEFDVPKGTHSIRSSIALKDDPRDTILVGLVDPNGQLTAFNVNQTTDNFGRPISTRTTDVYAAAPEPGRWRVILTLLEPVTGRELVEPFRGAISLRRSPVSDNLPSGKDKLKRGKGHKFRIHIANAGISPQAYFVDPRLKRVSRAPLVNVAGKGPVPLPLAGDYSTEPTYLVPPETNGLFAHVRANVPVTFDIYPGSSFNPDIMSGVKTPGATSTVGAHSASIAFSEPQIAPGIWYLDPSEVGPYGASGAPDAHAQVHMSARMQTIDKAVTSQTGNLWTAALGVTKRFRPQYVPVGDGTTLTVKIKPRAKVGTKVRGVIYVEAVTLTDPLSSSANEVVALPYHYKVK